MGGSGDILKVLNLPKIIVGMFLHLVVAEFLPVTGTMR